MALTIWDAIWMHGHNRNNASITLHCVKAAFHQFRGICNINYLEFSLKVIRGHSFWHQLTSYVILHRQSIVTFVLSCSISEILQLLCSKQPLFPYHSPIPPGIWECYPWTRLIMLGCAESDNPSPTMHIINFFKLTQTMWPQYLVKNITGSQSDGWLNVIVTLCTDVDCTDLCATQFQLSNFSSITVHNCAWGHDTKLWNVGALFVGWHSISMLPSGQESLVVERVLCVLLLQRPIVAETRGVARDCASRTAWSAAHWCQPGWSWQNSTAVWRGTWRLWHHCLVTSRRVSAWSTVNRDLRYGHAGILTSEINDLPSRRVSVVNTAGSTCITNCYQELTHHHFTVLGTTSTSHVGRTARKCRIGGIIYSVTRRPIIRRKVRKLGSLGILNKA